jgi:hypothetical protein
LYWKASVDDDDDDDDRGEDVYRSNSANIKWSGILTGPRQANEMTDVEEV